MVHGHGKIMVSLKSGGGLPPDFKYVTALSLTIDPQTFIISGELLDQNGDVVGTTQTIDLPFESVVVNGRYDDASKTLVLELQNGNEVTIPVASLVDGLQETLVSGENIKTINNQSILGAGDIQVSPLIEDYVS